MDERSGYQCRWSDLPVPTSGILATHFVVARDIETTARFYSEVLGGEVVVDGNRIGPGAPTYVKLANIIEVGQPTGFLAYLGIENAQ
jgi:catechol 2,3-dioxygenase-like lactoylglutathione lyase family enzyme